MKPATKDRERFKVWITKYALTSGIFEAEAEHIGGRTQMIKIDGHGSMPRFFHGEGRDWHRSAEAALGYARHLRTKRIASLEKKIARLRGLFP